MPPSPKLAPVPSPSPPPTPAPPDVPLVGRQQLNPSQPNLNGPVAMPHSEQTTRTAPRTVANVEQHHPEAPARANDDNPTLTMKAPRP